MSLDIGIADKKIVVPYPSIRLSFDDDAYYWFCFPFFEQLSQRTGQMIDLYNGAWFNGETLTELENTINEIKSKTQQMPVSWTQCVGYEVGSYVKPVVPPKPIHSSVERDRLVQLLDNFLQLVCEARRDGKWVACLGD